MLVIDPAGPGGERVKLLDFGIAKLGTEAVGQGEVRTRTGTVIGTAGYMSPEQLRGEKVDGQSDVYSLGVVLYKMLAGQLPFTSDNGELAIATMHILNEPPPLLGFAPETPGWLSELIHEMLSKSPASRPTMLDVASRLQPHLPARLPSGVSHPALRSNPVMSIVASPTESAMQSTVNSPPPSIGALPTHGQPSKASGLGATPPQNQPNPKSGLGMTLTDSAVQSVARLPGGSRRLLPVILAVVVLLAAGVAFLQLRGPSGSSSGKTVESSPASSAPAANPNPQLAPIDAGTAGQPVGAPAAPAAVEEGHPGDKAGTLNKAEKLEKTDKLKKGRRKKPEKSASDPETKPPAEPQGAAKKPSEINIIN